MHESEIVRATQQVSRLRPLGPDLLVITLDTYM